VALAGLHDGDDKQVGPAAVQVLVVEEDDLVPGWNRGHDLAVEIADTFRFWEANHVALRVVRAGFVGPTEEAKAVVVLRVNESGAAAVEG
jgi:hypothetical protein